MAYTHVTFTTPEGLVETSVTRHVWNQELADIASEDGSRVEFRPATSEEIDEFINSGAQQAEDDSDYWFEQGWNEAKERDL
jgi:hypothetical protein